MKILIIGSAGMVGRKLTAALIAGRLPGTIDALTLSDVVETAIPPGAPARAKSIVADLSTPGAAEALIADKPDLIFHLAAIVSGEAEADFEKGYRVNLDATRSLFEAVRHENQKSGYKPRLVFTSTIAVFGEPFPDAIPDDFFHTPLSSYGTQKAMGELLLADYSRRGFFDGVGIRLPTIVVRPGAPNKAASGFFSGILREPLAGKEAKLPVGEETRHWFASPRAAVGFLLHAASLDTAKLGARRNLSMPGISATVGEEIAALRRAAGDSAVALIKHETDPAVAKLVAGWPRNFDAARATKLGFQAERNFDEIIAVHLEDELGGKKP